MSTDLVLPENPVAALEVCTDADQFVLLALVRAKDWLATATTVDEVKELRAQARAVEVYVTQKKLSIETVQNAVELRLRAERALGVLLADEPMNRGGRPRRETPPSVGAVTPPAPPTLAERGLDHHETNRARALAAVPDPEFERRVGDARAEGRLSRAAMIGEPSPASSDIAELGRTLNQLVAIAGRLPAELAADQLRHLAVDALMDLLDRAAGYLTDLLAHLSEDSTP